MPRLTINEGGQVSVFDVLDDEVTIGRGASSSIQIADSHASKNHAVIRRVNGRPKLIDLESKNGTRVNGEFKNQRWLEHGDAVSIGAAVMTFDAADATAQAPAPARAARPSPVVAGPTVSRAPAPAAYAPAPAAPRHAARRGRARDDEEGDDEEAPRRSRGSSNSVPVAVLMGFSALAVVAVLFLLLSHMGGASHNAMVLREAKKISAAGDYQGALDYLQKNGDPSDVDGYKSLKGEMDEYEGVLKTQASTAKEGEARKVFQQISNDLVEQWKNKISDEAFGERLRRLAQDYKGTTIVAELENAAWEPYPKMRALMAGKPAPPK